MKTRSWIILFGTILLACAIACVVLFCGSEKACAEIYIDGKLYQTLDLHIDRVLEIDTAYGHNTVTVKDGKLRITQADCPDGYCMDHRPKSSGAPIVCLPHRLVIEFSDALPDGISR